jgi:ABC-type uncharacterized transport system substrate-binding protein
MRRVGVLMSVAAGDPEGQARVAAFVQGLKQLGWTEGSNIQIDIRWGAGDADRFRRYAAELVALAPDAILAGSGATMSSLTQATRTVPIVFVLVPDPVGAGFVRNLERPGGSQGHSDTLSQCPLLGVKRTFGTEFCCDAQDALVVFSYSPEFIDRCRSKKLGSPGQ